MRITYDNKEWLFCLVDYLIPRNTFKYPRIHEFTINKNIPLNHFASTGLVLWTERKQIKKTLLFLNKLIKKDAN